MQGNFYASVLLLICFWYNFFINTTEITADKISATGTESQIIHSPQIYLLTSTVNIHARGNTNTSCLQTETISDCIPPLIA